MANLPDVLEFSDPYADPITGLNEQECASAEGLQAAAIILSNLDFQNPRHSARNTMAALRSAGLLPAAGNARFEDVRAQALGAIAQLTGAVALGQNPAA